MPGSSYCCLPKFCILQTLQMRKVCKDLMNLKARQHCKSFACLKQVQHVFHISDLSSTAGSSLVLSTFDCMICYARSHYRQGSIANHLHASSRYNMSSMGYISDLPSIAGGSYVLTTFDCMICNARSHRSKHQPSHCHLKPMTQFENRYHLLKSTPTCLLALAPSSR